MPKKWFVTGIKINNSYYNEGKRVLRQKLDHVLINIDKYLKSHDVEDLHQLRISIRRLRYPLEIFINFFPKKLFWDFYNKINKLQDSTGHGRDLDVMIMRLSKFQDEYNIKLPQELFDNLKNQRDQFYSEIDTEVIELLQDPILEEVKELIDYNRFVKHK
ncbi:MAG TPA: CHAD domain-containing protein [Bacteroidota bacterium]|jgi:CHAD domain-containing protein|nr:CHAD domain-containing protein [Bacteroidota bacterium]